MTFLLFTSSCSHDHKKIIQDSQVIGSCTDKIQNIKPPKGQEIIDFTKQATTGTASLAITGVGATTDALVIVLTHPATQVVLCLTTVALLSKGEHVETDVCQFISSEAYDPGLRHSALKNTKSWRCPNLDYISAGLRDVANCYRDKNESEKARLQLENILKNETLFPCLSTKEIKIIKNEIQRLQNS